jgi:Cu(I)/Ag(I) efflux system membrane fusion protein
MKNRLFIISITLIAGLFLGWLIFHPGNTSVKEGKPSEEVVKGITWTCSMHPQIRMEEAGKCPLCGMDLIPLAQPGTASADPEAVQISPEAVALANIRTSLVTRNSQQKEIQLYGTIQADERSVQSQVAHISGRIEKLYVSFTGEKVVKGQLLAKIYSPEIVTARQELIEAAHSKQSEPGIFEAAKEKLRELKLTENQITAIENSGVTESNIDVVSNTSGIVTAKAVSTGDYVSKGDVLYEISDLSKVWVEFDAYERDIQFLKPGDKTSFTLQAYPGENFSGIISFIDPVLDRVTRVAKIRVEAENKSGKFKPEMFVSGIVMSGLTAYKDKFVIPSTAVLWTGERSVVYVKQNSEESNIFKLREIVLGPSLGDSYIIMDGLSEGEEIVTNGTFYIDAASQLEGKVSMMNSTRSDNRGITKGLLNVSGNCEMCKERIEKTALSVPGVTSATWDVNSKKLNFDYEKILTDLNKVAHAVADAGHDNELFKSRDDVYNALPACCLYRK